MLEKLPSGTKISITRSIKTSFEKYMASIQWDENKYSIQDFITVWREYINNHASWYKNLDEETKNDPQFHQELSIKINETIEKILSEEPNEEQIESIHHLQDQLGTNIHYSCKSEAKFLEEKLNLMSKNK
ncbi:hypothetical protein [Rossellomorea sp. KS-H15a]|uniref:hypothetical protein n=1 Tax=Rossellomorea sp. KS-H15a TaxID=2963940 RepID=UPI0020C6C8BB|nr:hypothetical protein [Rossellomorea sp. KS-H15a]UTE77533.1 hypothetical protein M1J35_01565 [Rossellomorea sp. KS-H15a]